jgi:predicted RNA-binding Zn-ribbon protein involved in translation (DUF1610 family)
MKEWIVLSITTKCPVCGAVYIDDDKDAESAFSASWSTCTNCGFKGELPQK